MSGDMSDMTASALRPPRAVCTARAVASFLMSPRRKVTPWMGFILAMSTAITLPFLPVRSTSSLATWDQPPGEAPRSTTSQPGWITLNLDWSCFSLYAARERKSSRFARR